MNLSNFYNYSILTGVWNDLDYNVFKLVKEYLRVHLDRRLLNKDFDVFLDKIVKKEGRPRFRMTGFLNEYYNSKSYLDNYYYDENYSKYFIMGQEIMITKYERYMKDAFYNYNKGCHNITRRHFMSSLQMKFNEEHWDLNLDFNWDFNVEDISDNTIKRFIKQLMELEERLLLKNI